MRHHWGAAAALAASAMLTGCVQTRQFADLQFTPPSGDYKLLVLRPDVQVSSLTTGGMVEPRADWTDQARASIIAASGRAGQPVIWTSCARRARRQQRCCRRPRSVQN